MAPNKFEKHIKKQLEDREIQPSSNAWDKLSEKMDAASPQSPKKGYLWYGIAASIIGLIILSLYVNSDSTSIESNNQVVDAPEKSNEIISTNESFKEFKADDGDAAATDVVNVTKDEKEKVEKNLIEPRLPRNAKEQVVSIENNGSDEKTKDSKNVDTISKLPASSKIEVLAQSNPNLPNQDDDRLIMAEKLIDSKVLEILAQVETTEDGSYDITSLEVDSLMRRAQEEILAESAFRNVPLIDATSLLVEVEDELDPTFRDRIFKVLENKLLEASAAVATRNN